MTFHQPIFHQIFGIHIFSILGRKWVENNKKKLLNRYIKVGHYNSTIHKIAENIMNSLQRINTV